MTLHVIPMNDSGEHEVETHCACVPNLYDSRCTDRDIWVHNAFDKREFRERVTGAGEPGKEWEVVRE